MVLRHFVFIVSLNYEDYNKEFRKIHFFLNYLVNEQVSNVKLQNEVLIKQRDTQSAKIHLWLVPPHIKWPDLSFI